MLNVSYITDNRNYTIGFVTEYPQNAYIEKTVVTEEKTSEAPHSVLTVHLRKGEIHSFTCFASVVYCGQFGINVSDDGSLIYVISDDKGLWCYTYRGEIVWKTRYTSVGEVIINTDGTITCISSNKLIRLNNRGEKIEEQKIYPYRAVKASENIIYAHISEKTVALIDSQTLAILWKHNLAKLGLTDSYKAIIHENLLIIYGKNDTRLKYIHIELPDNIFKNCKYDVSLIKKDGFSGYIKMLNNQ